MGTSLSTRRDAAGRRDEPAFDRAGVEQYLKNPLHVEAFREAVTGRGCAPFLPVDRQAELARIIVEHHAEMNAESKSARHRELTAQKIHDQVVSRVLFARGQARQYTREQEARIEREDRVRKARNKVRDFEKACDRLAAAGWTVGRLRKDWPEGLTFPMTIGCEQAIDRAIRALQDLKEAIS
jgi:hypothetical protein